MTKAEEKESSWLCGVGSYTSGRPCHHSRLEKIQCYKSKADTKSQTLDKFSILEERQKSEF